MGNVIKRAFEIEEAIFGRLFSRKTVKYLGAAAAAGAVLDRVHNKILDYRESQEEARARLAVVSATIVPEQTLPEMTLVHSSLELEERPDGQQ